MLADPAVAREFTVEREDGALTTVLLLGGELDLAGAPRFSAVLEDAIERERGDVVLDCAELSFMEASAVSLVLDARRRLAAEGRTLTLEKAQGATRRVMEICDLGELLAR